MSKLWTQSWTAILVAAKRCNNVVRKKGKDLTMIKNWHPVSLLNTDYKILTKTLSRRLEKHIPSVIHSDQSGFVAGRYIGESIRFIEDLIEKFDKEDKEGIILQLDFEKAFDSVEWNFMVETLKSFNLGENFISFVKCCYTDIYSCVSNNGYTTNWFSLFRGMRQGCPLSCLLFILCAEIMSNRIRANENIHGIYIGLNEHKIKQFADDCTCFVRDIPSIYTLIETIKGFTLMSGLNLNAGKSLLFFLGPWKNKEIRVLDIPVERVTIQILGVAISRCKVIKQKANFEDKIPKMNKQLQIYSGRDLSICGRILITKTFGISKFLHSLSIIDTNIDFQKTLQTHLNRYIWGYKPAKVKHCAMIGKLQEGGLSSIDVESKYKALRVAWVYRILNGTGWNDIVNDYFSSVGGLAFLLKCNYDTNKLPCFIPRFYKEMLDYGKEIFFNEFSHMIIWNNRSILVENKSIFLNDWAERGVIFVQDLLNQNGSWMSFGEFTDKYNIRTNFLRYMGVISAIKAYLNIQDIDTFIKPVFKFPKL